MNIAESISVYRQRRSRLAQSIGEGIAIVPTAPERVRNRDSHFPYRFDSHFYYLTGFPEPEAVLVVAGGSTPKSLLFCREKNPERETWEGFRHGPEAARERFGFDEAHPVSALDAQLPGLLENQPALHYPVGADGDWDRRVLAWLNVVRAKARAGTAAPDRLQDVRTIVDDMRLVKDPQELALMRRAARITSAAHRRAMQATRPGRNEYEIEAELLHEFRRHGAQSPAYGSIVAAGANACVLHYAAADAELKAGDLCLIDAGCELDGYASDVTRTFPADGRFSAPQRELYEIVHAAQAAAVAATKPGARKQDAHWAAVRVIAQGLLDAGLLSRDKDGDVEAVVASAAYRRFYMHGTGHWLGREVHDVGEYLSLEEAPAEEPDGLGGRIVRRPSRRLEPGMVVTIEPGLYVRPAEGVPERYWHIGIRIEDDALVTAEGCELISRGVPVAAGEIEALMRS
jgi:Xaa-Pro aminopeptidase